MRPAFRILVLTASLAAIVLFLTGPRRGIRLPAGPPDVLRGAFHVHTTRSDGALDKDAVAAAAARAGLQFAVFTDHGDATDPPDPPAYIHGVLCIDGVEISTNGGHYIALDMPSAPYPLGGDATAVVEDVARLGGFGVAAHPGSPRPELAWTAWDAPIDGLEWLNADSAWRDEGKLRLARTMLDYLWRRAGALASILDRPEDVLARFDDLAASRRVVALAGHDAHGGFGAETGGRSGRRLHIPSYEATFRTFAVYVKVPAPPGGDAIADAAALVTSIRAGRVFTAIEAIATPATLEFAAHADGVEIPMGGELPPDAGPATFRARTAGPDRSLIRLLRNGRPVAEASGGVVEHRTNLPGAYRVEVAVPGAPGTPPVPWLVTNPIYRFPRALRAAVGPPSRLHPLPVRGEGWRAESSAGSTGLVLTDGESVGLWYALQGGVRESQFAALVTDLQELPADATHLQVRGRAERPMRVSVQLRFAGGDERWRHSIYLDPDGREVLLRLSEFRAADAPGAQPPLLQARSLLFVVDLTNARPGEQGSFAVSQVAFGSE